MAKQKMPQRKGKVPHDGYIAPRDPANVLQNPAPPQPDPAPAPPPPAPNPHVVKPPSPGPSSGPLVP